MAVASFGGNAISSLQNILNGVVSRGDAGVGAAQNGVNAVLAGGSDIRKTVDAILGQAERVNGQGDALNKTAGEVKDQYAKIDPIVSALLGYGDGLWNEGESLSSEAKDVFGQGKALVSLDPSAGGLAGEFIKYWQSLSPDRYVSQAASDVQGSFGNAAGQAERDLARRGVSASSGAYGALRRQLATSLATALAAAKTKARQTGLDQQASQLDRMVSAANTLYGMGNATEQNALQAKGLATSAQGKAGDLIATKGQGLATAGNLFSSAGGLQTNYLGLINSAYGNLANAYGNAANAALGAANAELRANLSVGGGGGGSGGATQSAKAGTTQPTGAWRDFNHGTANRKWDGADWQWDPNAQA